MTRFSHSNPTRSAGLPAGRLPLFARSTRPWLLGAIASSILTGLVGCGPLALDRGNEADEAKAKATDDRVAVVIEGEPVTVDEVDEYLKESFLEELRQQPDEQIFEARERAIRKLIQKRIVDDEAKARGVTPEELFDEITGAAPVPTDEDLATWYAENQSRLRGAQLADIEGELRGFLANERRAEAWQQFLAPRLEALSYEMVLAPPREELEPTRLVRGPADAPVTIMAFSDYQCPYCIRSEPVLAEVLARYPDQVRLIHRHFPLDNIHPFARPAAEAAMCAEEQGKFWEYHDAIFARSGRLEEGSVAEIGGELGLDLEAFGACVEERRYAEFVSDDMEAGRAAGVTGTPAFFINGIPLKGARNADQLSQVVDAELARLASDS